MKKKVLRERRNNALDTFEKAKAKVWKKYAEALLEVKPRGRKKKEDK